MIGLRRKRTDIRWVFAARGSLLVALVYSAAGRASMGAPFYMGADISLETFMQQQNSITLQPNAQFYDNSTAAPLDTILYDRGANIFRLRVFVNPQTSYTNSNTGAIQTTDYDIALAQQIKAHAPNAKILLDFMYSDTWADPGKQGKPAAWTNLPLVDSVNHNDLVTKVQTYTQSTLQAFADAGVMPNMVQVGNEISSGMLFGTGSGTNSQGGKLNFSGTTAQQQASWQNLGLLLNAAIQGVRAAQGTSPKIDVAVHIDQGDQDGHPQFYFGDLTKPTWGNVTDFDVMGVSYYPTTRASHGLNYLQNNLNAVADAYPGKKVMVLETNYPWESSSLAVPDWAATPAGQQQFLTDLQNVVRNVHNGAGEGIVYWYPEAVQVPGFSIYNSGATALFDNSHNGLAGLSTFGITLTPGDYDHNGIVDASDYAIWRATFGSTTDLRADGDHSGTVDQGDYDTWMSNFGNVAGAGAGANSAVTVPEPPTLLLLALGIVTLCVRGNQRRG